MTALPIDTRLLSPSSGSAAIRLAPPTIDDLCAEVLRRREATAKSNARSTPQHTPRASSIGDCDREIALSVNLWKQKPPPDPHLMQRFNRGNDVERMVHRDLVDMGFDLVESQRTLTIESDDGRLLCTGHVDGYVKWKGLEAVFECKSLNPNLWQRINSIDDFNRFGWFRKYPRQLLLYMHASTMGHALMFVDDCLGHWKILPMTLAGREEELKALLRRLESIADHKKAGTLPDYIDDPKTCRECWAFKGGHCTPPLNYAGTTHVINNPELERLLDLINEHAEAADLHNSADRKAKEHFKARGAGEYIVGNNLVQVEVKPRKSHEYPDDIKAKYQTEGTTTLVKYERFG